jgi:hypothetical protein
MWAYWFGLAKAAAARTVSPLPEASVQFVNNTNLSSFGMVSVSETMNLTLFVF